MKKIISLLVAVATAFSVTSAVFAAIPEGAAPKAIVTVAEDADSYDADYDVNNYGHMYTLTFDFSDLGTLTHSGTAAKATGDKITQWLMDVKGDVNFYDGFGNLGDAWNTNDSSNYTGIRVNFTAGTGGKAYPSSKTTGVTDCEEAYTLYMYGVPGSKVTLTNAEIGYVTFSSGNAVGTAEYKTMSLSEAGEAYAEEIVITLPGEVEPEPAADVVVNSGKKYDNGYAWNVTVNKDMEAFGVKFYSGEETLEKSVKNVDALPKLDGGVGYNFNVGLKTAKTINQADFTADDATASWKAE